MLRWLLGWTLLGASLLALTLNGASGDADFQSVRNGLLKDYSGKGGDPKEKFFHESVFHPHYDGRFADKTIPEDQRRTHLVALIQIYLSTMADLGVETWLMHGTLMGWWWNRKILPWDSDIDVQMTLDSMAFLYNYYQLYVFYYRHPNIPEGREYMLEINPDYYRETKWDRLNSIDARFIDMTTGVFIDITAVRPNEAARSEGQPGALKCKDKHKYNESDIFPLRDSYFEGVPVKIPYEYTWLLEEEYSRASLTRTEFEKHIFNQTTMEWEPIKGKPNGPKSGYRLGTTNNGRARIRPGVIN